MTTEENVLLEDAGHRAEQAMQRLGLTADEVLTRRGALKDFVAEVVRQNLRERN